MIRDFFDQQRAFANVAATLRLKSGEWAFLCNGHMGDTFALCSFAKALLTQKGGEGFVAVVRSSAQDLPILLPGVTRVFIEKLPPVGMGVQLYDLGRHFSNGLKPGRIIPAPNRLWTLLGSHRGQNMYSEMSRYLGLREGTRPSRPLRPSAVSVGLARDLLERHNLLSERTVILAPHSLYLPPVPMIWWKLVRDFLAERGLSVVTNVAGSERAVEGTAALNIPLSLLGSVAESCAAVISARSGLADILAGYNTKLAVLYLSTPFGFLKRRSIDTFGFAQVRDYLIRELILSPTPTVDEIDLLYKTITNLI